VLVVICCCYSILFHCCNFILVFNTSLVHSSEVRIVNTVQNVTIRPIYSANIIGLYYRCHVSFF
jgi:hypothetical protein